MNSTGPASGLRHVGSSETVTYTGRYFDPLKPRASDVCIEDIAHSLALTSRFNGHCKHFYSVAEHSIWVALEAPKHLKFHALLHDAAEAYVGDMVMPLKRKMEAYRAIETNVMWTIAEYFNLDARLFDDPAIKLLDRRALRREQLCLTARPNDDWAGLRELEPLGPPITRTMGPVEAELNFATVFNDLKPEGVEPCHVPT